MPHPRFLIPAACTLTAQQPSVTNVAELEGADVDRRSIDLRLEHVQPRLPLGLFARQAWAGQGERIVELIQLVIDVVVETAASRRQP